MAVGDVVTIVEGAFAGFSGTVTAERGDNVLVNVMIFGRITSVSIAVAEIRGMSMAAFEEQVADAVRRRGFGWGQRRMYFWQDAARRDPPPDLAELAREHHRFQAAINHEEQVARDEALAQFRAAFDGLSDAERSKKWIAERETWTAWRPIATALADARDAELFPGLDVEAKELEQERLDEAATALRKRVEAIQRAAAFAAPSAPEPRNAAMEHALERELRDDAFLVYADWLQANGNPRGELIALDIAGPERSGEAQRLREKLMPVLLGPLAAFEDRLAATWRCGFLDAIRIETTRADEEDEGFDVGKLLDAALKLPSARFLRDLRIACPSIHEEVMLSPILHANGPRPSLRRLAYETNLEEEMLSWTTAGEVALHALYPNLEELEVHAGSYSLTAPELPKLRRLILKTCSIDLATIQSIIAADWPALEELELWFGSSSYDTDIPIDQLRSLLHTPFPKLRSLALSNGEHTDELCLALLESPLLPQLTTLEVTKSTMTDTGANHLVANAERLRHLERLDVDDNYLPDDVLAQLQRALPQTRSSEQRVADEYEGSLRYYASVGE